VRFEQLELGSGLHGGKRKGSGAKKREGALVPHRTRRDFKSRYVQHVTIKVHEGLRSLRANGTVQVVWQQLSAGREYSSGSEAGAFRAVHASIQGNHIHLLCEATDRHSLARGMCALKTRLAKALNRHWSRKGPVFRERYHSHLLTSPTLVRRALAYLFGNSTKHGQLHPAHQVDTHSTAPFFTHWTKRPVNQLRPESSPLARPETWLLELGFLRAGGPLPLTWHPPQRVRLSTP